MDLPSLPTADTLPFVLIVAIIGAMVALIVNKFLSPVLSAIVKPFFTLKEWFYRWIAPRNPLSISIRSYRKHIER